MSQIFTFAHWFDDIWLDNASADFTWEDFSALAYRFFQGLGPVTAISQAVNNFVHIHGLRERVGVHVRHTDNILEYRTWEIYSAGHFNPAKISRLEGFHITMDSIARSQGLFLATDNPQIAQAMQARYGSRLVMFPKKFSNLNELSGRQRTTGIDIALIDLLLLGCCHEVVGTYYSSFSQLAALLGDVRYAEIHGLTRVNNPGIHTHANRIKLRSGM
jgi:hypothetical protein